MARGERPPRHPGGRTSREKSVLGRKFTSARPRWSAYDEAPPADLVLFCVKSFDTEAAADVIRPVVGPDTGVLSIQNGVDNEDKPAAILGPGHVIAGIAEVFATIEAPGVISHGLLGRLRFGEMSGKESERVRAFLAACGAGRYPRRAGRGSSPDAAQKDVFLVAQSGMTALTRCPVGVLARCRRRAPCTAPLRGAGAGGREGVAIDDTLTEAVLGRLDTLGPGAFSSLHFDLAHGSAWSWRRCRPCGAPGRAARHSHARAGRALCGPAAACDGRPREAVG